MPRVDIVPRCPKPFETLLVGTCVCVHRLVGWPAGWLAGWLVNLTNRPSVRPPVRQSVSQSQSLLLLFGALPACLIFVCMAGCEWPSPPGLGLWAYNVPIMRLLSVPFQSSSERIRPVALAGFVMLRLGFEPLVLLKR